MKLTKNQLFWTHPVPSVSNFAVPLLSTRSPSARPDLESDQSKVAAAKRRAAVEIIREARDLGKEISEVWDD